MTPALIEIIYTYKLDNLVKKNTVYSRLHEECLTGFISSMTVLKGSDDLVNITDYQQLPDCFKNVVDNSLNKFVEKLTDEPYLAIPGLSELAGGYNIKSNGHFLGKIEANTVTKQLSMNLHFMSETFTWLGTMNDQLILAFGDNTAELIARKPIALFFIKYTSDIFISSYKKILIESSPS